MNDLMKVLVAALAVVFPIDVNAQDAGVADVENKVANELVETDFIRVDEAYCFFKYGTGLGNA